LRELLEDPQRCVRLGANGRRAVENGFSFDTEAQGLINLVNQLSQRR